MTSEHEQLEAWWATLPDDLREEALQADLDDLPGWIIASAVAAHIRGPEHSSSDPPDDYGVHLHDELREFIASKRDG